MGYLDAVHAATVAYVGRSRRKISAGWSTSAGTRRSRWVCAWSASSTTTSSTSARRPSSEAGQHLISCRGLGLAVAASQLHRSVRGSPRRTAPRAPSAGAAGADATRCGHCASRRCCREVAADDEVPCGQPNSASIARSVSSVPAVGGRVDQHPPSGRPGDVAGPEVAVDDGPAVAPSSNPRRRSRVGYPLEQRNIGSVVKYPRSTPIDSNRQQPLLGVEGAGLSFCWLAACSGNSWVAGPRKPSPSQPAGGLPYAGCAGIVGPRQRGAERLGHGGVPGWRRTASPGRGGRSRRPAR